MTGNLNTSPNKDRKYVTVFVGAALFFSVLTILSGIYLFCDTKGQTSELGEAIAIQGGIWASGSLFLGMVFISGLKEYQELSNQDDNSHGPQR